MLTHRAVKASNSLLTAATAPRVAVFVGATQGIGRATLERLVAQGLPLRAYVVARNVSQYRSFFQQLSASNHRAEIIFLEGQVSLLSDVQRLCDDISEREESIDVLHLSAGFIPFGGRQLTAEGLDTATVLAYYSRLLFITRLLPLLEVSAHPSPRIINVLAAGFESTDLVASDLDLADGDHYNVANITRHGATFTTLLMARLAAEYPRVSLIHHHPGFVSTQILSKNWGLGFRARLSRGFLWAMQPLMRPFMWSPRDAGERTVFLMTSAKFGGGAGGAPLQRCDQPAAPMRTLLTKEDGLFYAVDGKFQSLQLGRILLQLERSGMADRIEGRLEEVLKPYF